MRIVLDSNCLLVSIGKKSKYRIIFDSFLNGNIKLLVTNEVLFEYSEILDFKTNSIVSNNILESIISNSNVERFEIYFNWQLIETDKDDNKFVDLAIAADSDYIVTNDKHFNELKIIDFHKVEIISLNNFLEILTKNQN